MNFFAIEERKGGMLRQTAGGIGAREWLLSLTNLADLDFAIDEEEALAVYDNQGLACVLTLRLSSSQWAFTSRP